MPPKNGNVCKKSQVKKQLEDDAVEGTSNTSPSPQERPIAHEYLAGREYTGQPAQHSSSGADFGPTGEFVGIFRGYIGEFTNFNEGTSNGPTHPQRTYFSSHRDTANQPGQYVNHQSSTDNVSGMKTVTQGGLVTKNLEVQPRLPGFQQSMVRVQQYMREVTWRPTSGTVGVPQTDEEAFFYVSAVAKAIADVSNVLDAPYCQSAFQRFTESQWSRQDIHAMAHVIVSVSISLHERGATSIVFKKAFAPDDLDSGLTFPQRMEWFVKLLRQFKGFCDMIMRGTTLQELLASAKFSYETYCRRAEAFHRRVQIQQQQQQQQRESFAFGAVMTPTASNTSGRNTGSGTQLAGQTTGPSFPQPPEANIEEASSLRQKLHQRGRDIIAAQEARQQDRNARTMNGGRVAPLQYSSH
jgi:hypothetical protein